MKIVIDIPDILWDKDKTIDDMVQDKTIDDMVQEMAEKGLISSSALYLMSERYE